LGPQQEDGPLDRAPVGTASRYGASLAEEITDTSDICVALR